MKKLILLVIIVNCCYLESNANSWLDNFRRMEFTLSYNNSRIVEKNILPEFGNEVHYSHIELHWIEVNICTYLPLFEPDRNFSIGLEPGIGLGSYYNAEIRSLKYAMENTDNEDNHVKIDFGIKTIKLYGSLQLKLGADATTDSTTAPWGLGLGIGYMYFYPYDILNFDMTAPIVSAKAIFKYDPITYFVLKATVPLFVHQQDLMKLNAYSVAIGATRYL